MKGGAGFVMAGLSLLSVVASCASSPPRAGGGHEDGWTNERPVVPTASTPPSQVGPPWILDRELPSLKLASKRAPSQHLDGAHEGEVLANEASRPYPSTAGRTPLREGSMLVERLFPAGRNEVAAYFVMVKRGAGFDRDGNDWEYLVVMPQGAVEARGVLPLCQRCHAEAPRDFVFGGGR